MDESGGAVLSHNRRTWPAAVGLGRCHPPLPGPFVESGQVVSEHQRQEHALQGICCLLLGFTGHVVSGRRVRRETEEQLGEVLESGEHGPVSTGLLAHPSRPSPPSAARRRVGVPLRPRAPQLAAPPFLSPAPQCARETVSAFGPFRSGSKLVRRWCLAGDLSLVYPADKGASMRRGKGVFGI
jgi:hypothetical protein